jgi:murein DD-endopeptidase MepM/ murein hydrolase activator NlpD
MIRSAGYLSLMIFKTTLLTAALVMLHAAGAPAMAQIASPSVSWRPSRPQGGTLVRISVVVPSHGTTPGDTVVGPDASPVAGTLAGEPLHFAPDRAGGFVAFGGIPVDATDAMPLHLFISRGESRDTVVRHLRLSAVKRPVERLSVAPSFGKEPDSALTKRLADEARRAREVSVRAHETPPLWRSPFLRPRASRVTSAFGGGREFNGTVRSRHMGVDFAGAVGTPVRATNRGVVALVDTFYLAGRAVYIDHGAGLVTAYFHLSRADVAVGDTVTRGQVIGLVGQTGRVTGPHLHWVARYGAITVDPLGLVSLTAAPTPKPAASAKRSRPASGTGGRRAPR